MANAAMGFRVKSGWAAAIVLSNSSDSPTVRLARRIDLCDPAFPETRQPYHATDDARCELEEREDRLRPRLDVIRRVTNESIRGLLGECRANGWTPRSAGIVGGSLTDPLTIRSPHVRAHALDGRTFRTVVEDTLTAVGLSCVVLGERAAVDVATEALHRDERALRKTLAYLGRGAEGPWRADQKLAALAAWVALSNP